MKIGDKKRGLSPVIATVLLILLVVVIISMIFVWARTFFNDQTEDSERPISGACIGVDFIAKVIGVSSPYKLEIVNRGNVNISSFEIKKYSGGLTEVDSLEVSVPARKSVTEVSFSENMKDGNSPDRVEMFAVLDGASPGKVVTCEEPEYLNY